MSVPAVAEHGGWQSRRVRRLSASASAYAAVVALCALVSAAVAVAGDTSTKHEWLAFAILLPLAATAPLFRVPVGRNHSLHAAPAFVVAGALVLPPLLVVALVLALHAPLAIRDRYPWYIQAFNIANFTLSGLAAWLAVETIGQNGDLGFALSGVVAAGVFVLVNHLLLAVMLRLGRGHSFRETGLLSAAGLGVEFVIAALGVAVAEFATVNPWLVPAVLAPLALAHRSLSTTSRLRETEERFRTMFEAAPTATMLFGTGGEIMTANRSALSLLGYEHDEDLLTHIDEIRHPDDSEDGLPLYDELMRGERDAYRREARFLTKDGKTIVTHLAVALVRDADGKPDFAIGMAEDVTDRKLLEEQLRQSQKLEAIGRLAGGVAHDFNNMLTAIGGYTAFALEYADEGSPLESDLDEIRKATDRAALLTRQLLAFSRKQVLTPELLNLNGIVVEMQTMLRPLIGEDILLSTQLDPALGPIEADPGQLHQVVMNLVVNARDAMPNGGSLTIETANADVDEIGDGSIEPGRYITLTVRDAGEGIDEETLGQIFEPFFTTKDASKGTGLGLATVYGIVKQSGGYVEVESEVGVGSAFRIYLRRVDDSRHRAEPPVVAAPPVASASQAVKRVLVVEDEEVVRGLVRQMLVGQGYEVLVAEDGEKALDLAGRTTIDVLLTDLTMPNVGGREVAERLRESQPDLKVIYMSGYAEDLPTGALPPSTSFIGKPFTFAELTETVKTLIAAP
jgi:two-component system, cell cycle sensor histidine kinase and response regulator CckA